MVNYGFGLTLLIFVVFVIGNKQVVTQSPLNVDTDIGKSNENDEITFAATSAPNIQDDMILDDEDDDDGDDSGSSGPNTKGPTTESSSTLNQTHANLFRSWIEVKSNELFSMTRNFSGFELLNSTYNIRLPKESNFSWINFTDMIMNISKSISEVLYRKTLVVKNMTDLVEKSFNEYSNNSDRVINSTMHVYYDAKSPFTFCDVAESYNNQRLKTPITTTTKAAVTKSASNQTTTATTTSTTKTTKSAAISNSTERRKRELAEIFYDEFEDDGEDEILFRYSNESSENNGKEFTVRSFYDSNNIFSHTNEIFDNRDSNSEYSRSIRAVKQPNPQDKKQQQAKPGQSNPKPGQTGGQPKRKPQPKRPISTTTKTSTTTTTTAQSFFDDEIEDNDDDSEEQEVTDLGMFGRDSYWEIQCINRTYDENFKSVQKINRNESTIQVPIQVYKQDIAINMTAYWTEALDEQFKTNYDQDNELFWQYFCSSNGLYRRYPAAYWSLPSEKDFFDCRLQSWYIMAAASPKDVILLLDTSGSMTGLRLEIGKKLIEFILDTLSDNDFFNVLTFSNKQVNWLFANETSYQDTFVQAGKENKIAFKKKLEAYKATSHQGFLEQPLRKVFNLFTKEELVRSRCNKIIMIITDGHADDVDSVFAEYNSDKRVRVFSFKIGRDMTNPQEIKDLACKNNGEYYHVVTLTDINEHVYEYISVLSRPMALTGTSETTWSNVFIGYLDKELKIAVARPAFRNVSVNFTDYELSTYRNLTIDYKIPNYEQIIKKNKNHRDILYVTDSFEQMLISNAEKEMRKHQVLLGVVGIDVPVLRLISRVSPKYQMGVGIYLIMLDNNGFIVFHPSIKKEIADSQFDYKGTSSSIDLDRFEIPIHNDEEFEALEHDMIDQILTSNYTLDNWKREGLRVIRRRTEYVFAPVSKTPFSVALASPSSFGRYYIDIPREREKDYEADLKELVKKRFDTLIQLYNCTYNYQRLADRIISPKQFNDYCIKYLFQDADQAIAIKSDLVLHNIYYNEFNYSMFYDKPNLIRSSFYGTYSGITFYIPVTFFKAKNVSTNNPAATSDNQTVSESNEYYIYYDTVNQTLSSSSQMPSTTSPTNSNEEQHLEAYNMSLNLFSTEGNKHTYSFEKQYYTRSIEFTDYIRTEFGRGDEAMAIYFLNESSKDTNGETLSAAMPIWIQKVPAAVAGVVYDAKKLQNLIFSDPNTCEGEACSLCSRQSGLENITCYLVDEHGIVVLTNSESTSMINQPLYKINPWLMLELEIHGLYDLIVMGHKLQDCQKPPQALSSASRLINTVMMFMKFIFVCLSKSIEMVFWAMEFNKVTLFANSQVGTKNNSTDDLTTQTPRMKMDLSQIEFRIKNSHCIYFGIYSFNLTKWRSFDPGELNTWCNSSQAKIAYDQHRSNWISSSSLSQSQAADRYDKMYQAGSQKLKPGHYRNYLVGYLKGSNLLMLVVENELQVERCGRIETLIQNRPPIWSKRQSSKPQPKSNTSSSSSSSSKALAQSTRVMRKDYTINRYRKNPEYCHNYYANESNIFFCNSFSISNIRVFKESTRLFTFLPYSLIYFFIMFVELFS